LVEDFILTFAPESLGNLCTVLL